MVSLILCKKRKERERERKSLDRVYNKKKYSLLSSRLYLTHFFIEGKEKHKDSFPTGFLREKTVNFETII